MIRLRNLFLILLGVQKGEISYLSDERGNRILDYSTCGYRQSNVTIPDVGNAIFVSWKEGDNTSHIQRAIDYVSSLAPNVDGFKGAVLLDKGIFELNGSLKITSSGVVLRGMDKEQTILLKKGVDRGALIYMEGMNDKTLLDTLNITCTGQ